MKPLRFGLSFGRLMVSNALLAVGQIRANKVRSALTMLGIVIGVASVTSVVAVLTSMGNVVLDDLESLGTNTIVMYPSWAPSGARRSGSWRRMAFRAEQFDGLLEHCPSVEAFSRVDNVWNGSARYGKRRADVRIRGIEPAWRRVAGRSVTLGRPFTQSDNEQAKAVCLITERLRDRLGLNRDCTGERIRILGRTFMIVGLVEPTRELSVLGDRDRLEALVPFRTSRKFFGGSVIALAASRSPELSAEAVAELRFFLRCKRNVAPGEPDTFGVETVQQYVDQFKRVTTVVTAVTAAVVGISLLVGGVGIMNIMLVSVSERTREIGLRKAVGAGGGAIALQFLIEAVVLCLLGGLIGVAAGQGIVAVVERAVPHALLRNVQMPVWAMAVGCGFAAVVGVVFGMIPALKAARLDPIEALRR